MADDLQVLLKSLLSTPLERIPYTVHSCSGSHSSFPPENISKDILNAKGDGQEELSRWSSPTPEERKKERRLQASGKGGNGSGRVRGRAESEWIQVELETVSLVKSVGFGKSGKPHPCNLLDFSVLGGLEADPSKMETLLGEGTLKHDGNTEQVEIDCEIEDEGRESTLIPLKYIRIECHEAAAPNYSISIWHLFLEGHILTPLLQSHLVSLYSHHKTLTTSHLILSHLRRTGSLKAFGTYLSSLPNDIKLNFEHSLVSELHRILVVEGDFQAAEKILQRCLEGGLLREWSAAATNTQKGGRRKGSTTARWERLDTLLLPVGTGPGPRGGHQMVRVGRKLVLFGGWDGKRDLGDLWEWELPRGNTSEEGNGASEGSWRCVMNGEEGVEGEKRPGKRSCHQLAVDEKEGWVYLLGARRDDEEDNEDDEREGRSAIVVPENWDEEPPSSSANGGGGGGGDAMEIEEGGEGEGGGERRAKRRKGAKVDRWKSDFWRYKAVGPGRGKWELISPDTRNDGGPALLFDHAMVVDSANQRLFVFGGKWQPYEGADAAVEDPSSRLPPSSTAQGSQYSGMYCYDIRQKKWSHLFGDPSSSSTPASFLTDRLLPRAGHSMILDPSGRNPTIYIYGGQRDTRYENDFWAIRLASPRGDGSFDNEDEDEEFDNSEEGERDRLWRQGAVIDAPRRAIARSLIDASLLPVSPESSPSRNSSTPTILQIRKIALDTTSSASLPPAAFTPRLSITNSRSLTLLTGLTRVGQGASMEEVPLEGVWRRGRGDSSGWEKIEEWGVGSAGQGGNEERRPKSRFASQVCYDPLRNEHYVFGGHPHDAAHPETRLSDFWKLKIVDPTPEEALRMATFLVRKQRFNEMCTSVPTLLALQYLQNDLSSVVDHSSPSESTAFRSCMTALLSAPPQHNVDVSLDGSGELPSLDGVKTEAAAKYAERHQLFEELIEFFPRGERQPVDELDQVGRLLRTAKR